MRDPARTSVPAADLFGYAVPLVVQVMHAAVAKRDGLHAVVHLGGRRGGDGGGVPGLGAMAVVDVL
jgi:hypothetical protein